jgi:hypothetical protein
VRQELSCAVVDDFFAWLNVQVARVWRKSDFGEAMAYVLRRQNRFRLSLEDGLIDIDPNLVENAIRSPAVNRRHVLFFGPGQPDVSLRDTEGPPSSLRRWPVRVSLGGTPSVRRTPSATADSAR